MPSNLPSVMTHERYFEDGVRTRFYQRAEPPLINGSWSHLAGGRVNFCVLTFCKFGITEALIGQRNTASYQINTPELKFLVRFDPEAIISL